MLNLIVEYKEYIYIFTTSIILLFTVYALKNRFEIFNESPTRDNRKVHDVKVTRIGGLSLIPIFIYINHINLYPSLNVFFLSCAVIFIIGFIEDVSRNISYIIRFLILVFVVFYLTFFFDTFRIAPIDYNNYSFIKNYFFLSTFSLFGILFCINGSNFIDGLNGLTLGTSIIIFLNYIYLAKADSDIVFAISLATSICIVPLFLLNICSGAILTGDSGSYLIGFIYGCMGILLFNTGVVPAFHVACILFYPTTELVFTFFRRVYYKDNPFKPDHLHLHTILFMNLNYYLTENKIILKKTYVNSLTTFIILIFLSLANVSFTYIFSINNYLITYVILNVIYLILYLSAYSNLKKTSG